MDTIAGAIVLETAYNMYLTTMEYNETDLTRVEWMHSHRREDGTIRWATIVEDARVWSHYRR